MSSLIWFPVAVAFVYGSVQLGFLLGRRRRQSVGADDPSAGPSGSVVGSLLALLAFLLAFTFQIASARHERRKQLVLEESNAIGTAALRADLLAAEHATRAKDVLRTYANQRAQVVDAPDTLPQALRDAPVLHERLWQVAREAVHGTAPQPAVALFIGSVNEVIDLHQVRTVVALQYRIPEVVWYCLAGLTFLAMLGVGYQFGFAGRENVWLQSLLALSYGAVIWLIVDLDDPGGALRISQQPMLDLVEQLQRQK
ncbi:MAG: hypothetical protein KF830_12305 [Planctomycetes bacterium]|nr:hypothetical protein [Planctomycetota bacterium]